MTRLTSRHDGTELHVESWGQASAPLVVLVPGLGESIRSWGRVPELLASDHHVVAFDLRGHGESSAAASGDYELPAHAADLATVLAEAVPGHGSYVLVGHSWGGAVILGYAREGAAAGLAGAVFVGSSGSAGTLFGISGDSLPTRVQTALRLRWVRMFHLASVLHRRPLVRSLIDHAARFVLFGPGASTEVVDEATEAFLATDPKVLADTMFASVREDYTGVGRYLTAPSLVLWGKVDRQDTRKKVDELVRALPDVQLVALDRVSHMAPLTHPELVAEHIGRWVRVTSAPKRETPAQEVAR
jgi:pimeloyl-ACP methyl ester carboxylesterase